MHSQALINGIPKSWPQFDPATFKTVEESLLTYGGRIYSKFYSLSFLCNPLLTAIQVSRTNRLEHYPARNRCSLKHRSRQLRELVSLRHPLHLHFRIRRHLLRQNHAIPARQTLVPLRTPLVLMGDAVCRACRLQPLNHPRQHKWPHHALCPPKPQDPTSTHLLQRRLLSRLHNPCLPNRLCHQLRLLHRLDLCLHNFRLRIPQSWIFLSRLRLRKYRPRKFLNPLYPLKRPRCLQSRYLHPSSRLPLRLPRHNLLPRLCLRRHLHPPDLLCVYHRRA